ncbi:MAG: NYN domain-containing protein [Anaerolineales bacterium]|nr:NYN domain-containing protein [Anaerolineales bacterium]
MTEKHTVYAFVDSQNLNLGVSNDIVIGKHSVYSGWKLDFRRFFVYLKDKYRVDKVYLFIGKKPGNQSLYDFLEEVGYEMIYKPTISQKDGVTKGNVDAELVLHSMIELPNYDQAIIVSGDGDFLCLIEHLDGLGKLKALLVPNRHRYSSLLRKFATKTAYISDLKEKLEFKTKREG